MTFISSEDGASSIPLLTPEAPFLVGIRTFETMQDMQAKWWQAWMGLWGRPLAAQPRKPDAEPETNITA